MSKQILPRLQLHYAGFFLLSFLISMGTAIAQTTTVSGTVTDELNEGLPGVNIIVKGTSQGTISDIEGKYTLSEISSSDTLLFSSV